MAALAKAIVNLVYPPECAGCRTITDAPHGLCPACWADTTFITGPVCDSCGTPEPLALPGQVVLCEGCTARPRAWDRGRAAVIYDGTARDIILRFKHRDRLDLAAVLARWLARAAPDLLAEADIIAPVPLHWTRLIRRRANQAAELTRHRELGADGRAIPDLLLRRTATPTLKGKSRDERAVLLQGAIRVNPRKAKALSGANLLLVDDVMTTGATLSAAAEAARAAGAGAVNVLVIARVAREGFAPI